MLVPEEEAMADANDPAVLEQSTHPAHPPRQLPNLKAIPSAPHTHSLLSLYRTARCYIRF